MKFMTCTHLRKNMCWARETHGDVPNRSTEVKCRHAIDHFFTVSTITEFIFSYNCKRLQRFMINFFLLNQFEFLFFNIEKTKKKQLNFIFPIALLSEHLMRISRGNFFDESCNECEWTVYPLNLRTKLNMNKKCIQCEVYSNHLTLRLLS